MRDTSIIDYYLPSLSISNRVPSIRPGESSSSEVLNNFFKACNSDIASLIRLNNRLATAASNIYSILPYQETGANALLAALSARVSSLSLTGQALVSLHSSANIVSSDTTVTINNMFGQATLPITNTTDLLVYHDLAGDTYTVGGGRVFSAVKSTTPSDSDWTYYDLSENFLVDDVPLIVSTLSPTGAQTGWIRLDLPDLINSLPVNVIEIYPIPAFNYHIESIEYQSYDAAATSTWTALDIAYLPGYAPSLYSNTYVNNAGPIRLLTSEIYPRSIRIKVRFTAPLVWGLAKLKLKHHDYDKSGILKIQNPNGSNIGTTVVRGQGNNLSLLTKVASTSYLTVTLNKIDSMPTPVITGIHIQSYA